MDYNKQYSHLLDRNYGVICSQQETQFLTFAVDAESVAVALYDNSDALHRLEFPMTKEGPDIWSLTLLGDYHGKLYTYLLTRNGKTYEIVDPYAVSAGINSKRGGIVDLSRTNPPDFHTKNDLPAVHFHDIVLYELHIRDFTVDQDSGIVAKGKYAALTEFGTQNQGLPTGVDHLLDLGITHVHLLPIADFGSVNDRGEQYNWGYDPILFNAPEGSYALVPEYPPARVLELKTMINALHEKGLRVILDVVYNHTYDVKWVAFERMAPHIFYREKEGQLTNGSGVGCELNTEHPLVRSFIVSSLCYWVTEFHVDGFRFDLMALYDTACVEAIKEKLYAIKPNILLYGEPWIGGESGLPEELQFLKGRQKGMNIALFNDEFRDAIKGDNDGVGTGLVQGNGHLLDRARLGIVGSISYSALLKGFTDSPYETINYVSSHDNLILRDKLEKTMTSTNQERHVYASRLALTLILTAFGIPFIQAGTELFRSKGHHHNTYNAGDGVNQILWHNKTQYYNHFAFIRALIQFRKTWGVFEALHAKTIQSNFRFISSPCLAYQIHKDNHYYVFYHNYHNEPVDVSISHPVELFFYNDFFDIKGHLKKETHHHFMIESKASLIYRVQSSKQNN